MRHFVVFLLVLPFLTACPPKSGRQTDSLKDFAANHYDLKLSKKGTYRNIRFNLPESFHTDYDKSHIYRSSGMTLVDNNLSARFTVERFFGNDIFSELMISEVISDDLLNSFHDAYVKRRINSREGGTSTYKKKLYHPLKYDFVIQTVSFEPEPGSDNAHELYYATATAQVGHEYYIFQFIAEREMMAYLFDDFNRILKSVRKIK